MSAFERKVKIASCIVWYRIFVEYLCRRRARERGDLAVIADQTSQRNVAR